MLLEMDAVSRGFWRTVVNHGPLLLLVGFVIGALFEGVRRVLKK